MPTDIFLPLSHCPNCAREINGAGHAGEAIPGPGDIVVCMYCGELSEFGEDLRLRPLSAPLSELPRDEIEQASAEAAKAKALGVSLAGRFRLTR